MISRKEAEEILFEHLKSENLRRHSLATAAVMEKLAERFDKPTEEWFIAGLLHDIDFEQTADDPDKSIKNIELKSLKKKYKNRAFAAGANREQIAKCCDFGIELDDFLQLSIDALASYETELGFGNQ